MNVRIAPAPRIGIRASAYPASAATTIVIAVVAAATIALLTSGVRKPAG